MVIWHYLKYFSICVSIYQFLHCIVLKDPIIWSTVDHNFCWSDFSSLTVLRGIYRSWRILVDPAILSSAIWSFIEKLYETLGRVFHLISKHLDVGQKYLHVLCFFNQIIGVWKSDETIFFVFDMLLLKLLIILGEIQK